MSEVALVQTNCKSILYFPFPCWRLCHAQTVNSVVYDLIYNRCQYVRSITHSKKITFRSSNSRNFCHSPQ